MITNAYNRIKNLDIFTETAMSKSDVANLMAAASLFECAQSLLYTKSLNGLPYGLNEDIMGGTNLPLCTKTIGTVMLFAFETYTTGNRHHFTPVYGVNISKNNSILDAMFTNLRFYMNSTYKAGCWDDTPVAHYENFKKFNITPETRNFLITVSLYLINEESAWLEDDEYSLEKEAKQTWDEMDDEEKEKFVTGFEKLPTAIQEKYKIVYDEHKNDYNKIPSGYKDEVQL